MEGFRTKAVRVSAETFRTGAYGAEQLQLAASFRSPEPLYFAYCGYAQIGRARPDCEFLPRICAGAWPFSRHCSSAAIESNVFGPGPRPQCCMPGTRNMRIQPAW